MGRTGLKDEEEGTRERGGGEGGGGRRRRRRKRRRNMTYRTVNFQSVRPLLPKPTG
jgi:hypothetical protein